MRALLLFPFFLAAPLHAAPLAESWQSSYSGADATGSHVIGFWRFQPGEELHDSSGHGHELTLAGGTLHASGKFDGALESAAGWPIRDQRHAALAQPAGELTPKGAFTAEMWIRPNENIAPNLSPVLLDKKYVNHSDYHWRITPATKDGSRRFQVLLGFGSDSETYFSDAMLLRSDWQHVAFTYDGISEVRFFQNGISIGSALARNRGPIRAGKHALSIGDRIGSYYAGFPGLIDEVRLSNGVAEFQPVAIEFSSERKTWLRMEKLAPQPFTFTIRNTTKQTCSDIKATIFVAGTSPQEITVPALKSGETFSHACQIRTDLRPGSYTIKARVEKTGPTAFVVEGVTEFTIAARPAPQMPVVMWGIGGLNEFRKELPRLKELGFTHCLGNVGVPMDAIFNGGKPVGRDAFTTPSQTLQMLDEALAQNFRIAIPVSPGHHLQSQTALQRIDRKGNPYSTPSTNPLLDPKLGEFCFNVGASIAKAFGQHPAWEATLINTEVRDSSQPSFSPADFAAYRQAVHDEIPAEIVTKNGVDWKSLKDFPVDRIIADDHPILNYYRWFWTVGDGWNKLHTATHKGLHSTGRDDMWTWFDPSIRAASLGGSGGEVDVLGQWSYTNQDPTRLGFFTDQLRAMAANSSQHPRVMKMTQLFWYRSQTTVSKSSGKAVASPFDDHDPDAAYITISPMLLRTAFWMKISRPLSGIMYHGWEALVETGSPSAYRHTNPDTQNEFRRLHQDVIKPLGPALLKVGDAPSDIAYLDSFTSQMFARRGSYGYGSDESYLTLLYAHLQPQIIYEEDVLKRGLDAFKILVLADCDVLTTSVAQRIREFQSRGGILIADANLAPGIHPDLLIEKTVRTKDGAKDKAALLANAAALRSKLDARYARAIDTTNPEIIPRLRSDGDSDYVFVANDHREAGPYVGQHGIVLENGLPSTGELTLTRSQGAVYDLLAHRRVDSRLGEGRIRWDLNLGPCEGRVFLVTPTPITSVTGSAPESVSRGTVAEVSVSVNGASGAPIRATVPLSVEITDSAGRSAERSGYYGTENGKLNLPLDLAPNDTTGIWQIHIRELAGGAETSLFFRVK